MTDPRTQALFDAIQRGDTAAVRDLAGRDGALLVARNAEGMSPLQWAVYTRQLPVQALILELGHVPDLFEAALLGDRSALLAHLARDSSAKDAVSPDGWPVLHLAAFAGHAELVSLLADAGADLGARSRSKVAFGNSALHAAIAGGHLAAATALLARGADPNFVQSPGGFTPLHIASNLTDPSITELLLGHGADTSRRTDQGDTALAIATGRGRESVAAILRRAGALE